MIYISLNEGIEIFPFINDARVFTALHFTGHVYRLCDSLEEQMLKTYIPCTAYYEAVSSINHRLLRADVALFEMHHDGEKIFIILHMHSLLLQQLALRASPTL